MWPESTVIMGSDIESVACRRGQTVLICMRWDELDELQFLRTIPLFSLVPKLSTEVRKTWTLFVTNLPQT